MKVVRLAVFLVVTLLAAPVVNAADPPSIDEKIEYMLKGSGYDDPNAMFQTILPALEENYKSYPSDVRSHVIDIERPLYIEYILSIYKGLFDAYKTTYKPSEIDELYQFYTTAPGKVLLEKHFQIGKIANETMVDKRIQLTRKIVASFAADPKLQDFLRQRQLQTFKHPETASPVPPAASGPSGDRTYP